MAEPITPEELQAIACINKKFVGWISPAGQLRQDGCAAFGILREESSTGTPSPRAGHGLKLGFIGLRRIV